MGQAKIRRLREQQERGLRVFMDLSGPVFVPLRNDAESQARRPDGEIRTADEVKAICMRSTILHAVLMRYQQGIGREASRVWAVWQGKLESNEIVLEVTTGAVQWLLDVLESEQTLMGPAFALYREALIAYLRDLHAEPASDQPTDQPDPEETPAS